MLDLFTIFSKGGIVLWCFQGTGQSLTSSVNALISNVILQERGGLESFTHEALALKYRLDNEFELVFVVAYQKFLQLSYVDKFLNDIQLEFRDRYKDDLQNGKICRNFSDFTETYELMLKKAEESSKLAAKTDKRMRTFDESEKSRKTVASMIERKKGEETKKGGKVKSKQEKPEKSVSFAKESSLVQEKDLQQNVPPSNAAVESPVGQGLDEATILENRQKLLYGKAKKPGKQETTKSPDAAKKKEKNKRQWDLNGSNRDLPELDHSKDKDAPQINGAAFLDPDEMKQIGQRKGPLIDLDPESSGSEDEDPAENTISSKSGKKESGGGAFGIFSGLRNLVGSKTLTREDIQPVLEKMRVHLIAKNVASEIAESLCDSVATKLEGKVLGTFKSIAATVKKTLEEACVQILTPHRRVDILRDALEAKQKNTPYVVTFCGVNGVGKSTNLAKICFWLIENDLRVLVAACDTFRAGAVEQLRTHCRKLNTLHPPEAHGGTQMVYLYEKGYGKDAAFIAMEAINYARDQHIDVVLVDTAGRMQDNEPLMRSLTKLIKVNQPDLVLFVGEALVGNEAVDQLTKFNQALADYSSMENPHQIDGIVLTKYDTIDDKVGASVSMTYITGKPIVFVGTGQTYTDLKNLNARSVVNALLK